MVLLAIPSDDSTWIIGPLRHLSSHDKLSFNLRAEYLSSDGSGLYDDNPVHILANTAEEFTATAQYNLWANVISRVEFRWDHVEHGNFFGHTTGTTARQLPTGQ